MSLNLSKLNFEKIQAILKNEYNITLYNASRMPGGSANLYRIIDENKNQYVLKEFQNAFDTNKVKRDINVTELVKKGGIPTTEFIYNCNNEAYCCNEGNILTLQKYIDGITKDYYSLNDKECEEAAQYCYKITKLLNESDISLPNFKMSIFEHDRISKSINQCDCFLKKCKDDEMIKALKDKKRIVIESNMIDFSHINDLTFLNSHGDYNTSQLIYDNDGKIKAIIDFASSKKLPIVWELLRSFIFMDRTYDNGKFSLDGLIKYLKVFNKDKVLNEYDIEYIFKVYYMFLINSMFGLEQYVESNNHEYYLIGLNLYHQSKYLNKNMTEMEKILQKRKMEVL